MPRDAVSRTAHVGTVGINGSMNGCNVLTEAYASADADTKEFNSTHKQAWRAMATSCGRYLQLWVYLCTV